MWYLHPLGISPQTEQFNETQHKDIGNTLRKCRRPEVNATIEDSQISQNLEDFQSWPRQSRQGLKDDSPAAYQGWRCPLYHGEVRVTDKAKKSGQGQEGHDVD